MFEKIGLLVRTTSKNIGKRRKLFLVVSAVLVLFLGIVLFRLVIDNKNSLPKNDSINSAEKAEARYGVADQENLAQKDYDSYQYSKLGYVNGYINGGNLDRATQILDEVQRNIPETAQAIEVYAYRAEIALREEKKDEYKKYMETLILKLNQQNRKPEAEYYRQQMKEAGL